jgi:hypothetical protein
VDYQWSGGAIVTVKVTNTSTTVTMKRAVTSALAAGQSVASAWNATVATTGTTAIAVNASYNGALAPGASTAFGMQLSGPASTPMPSCANDGAPPSGADVTVTQSDSMRAVTLYVGQTLGVSLSRQYVPPAVSGPVLTQVSASGGYPTGQPLVARYTATAAGQTDVSTVTDNPCFHQPTPCPSPQTPWRVHVTVTP